MVEVPAPVHPVLRPGRDAALLVVARSLRGFGAGALSVVFAIDLASAGYSLLVTGVYVGLAMGFGAAWAILAPRIEAAIGRRRLLYLGALLFAAGGALLWLDLAQPGVILVALALGGVVTGGSDISPLGATEQAGLAAVSLPGNRTLLFAYYNLAGYLAAAFGAVAAVPLSAAVVNLPVLTGVSHDAALLLYAVLGVGLLPAYAPLSAAAVSHVAEPHRPLSAESRRPVLELTGLFAVDAFGGGLIANTLLTAFLVERFHPPVSEIALILFGGNVAAAASLLLAVPIARRIGLIPTMVFTHLPSDVLLATVAFAPSVLVAGLLWVLRATLSQMDVPTRQSYVQAIVRPEERTAAAGYTTAARSGQALGAPVTGALLAAGGPWLAGPFVLAGSVKAAYDLVLYQRFRSRAEPPHAR